MLICNGPTRLHHRLVSSVEGRFVVALKPHPGTFLPSRHIPGGTICVDVQRKRRIIAEPRVLTKKGHCPRSAVHALLFETNVVATSPSDRFPGRVFPGVFPRYSLMVAVRPQ